MEEIRRITSLANFIYVRQKGPYGNATPILNSMMATGEEPFIVCWGDEFILSDPPMAQQLIDAHNKYGGMILGSIRTKNPDDGKRFGFAKGKEVEDGIIEVEEIVEKPGVGRAPSELATVAGFLFTSSIKSYLQNAVDNISDREPNYIDAITQMMKEKKTKVYAMEFKNSKYFDTGSKIGYLKASVEFGIEHEELGSEFKEYLKDLTKTF